MSYGRSISYFLLSCALYVSAYQKIYSNFYELSHYNYELHRSRRSSGNYNDDDPNWSKNKTTECSSLNSTCKIMETRTNDHEYYRSTYYTDGRRFFIDISKDDISKTKNLTVERHEKLSSSYKKAYQIPINFHFPFYGNYVDRIIVTTGGFINIGPKFHAFVHKVHYIAPFMADFNPSLSNRSAVYIGRGSNMVIVQWNDFYLNGKEFENKTFTFQVILYKNGTVIMAYKDIGIMTQYKYIRVTVGFADGFIMTFQLHDSFKKLVQHQLIYSYHKVNLPINEIKDGVAYQLELLPNCIQYKNCTSCLIDSKAMTNFTCKWCPALNQCSDMLDWNRQQWLVAKCDHHAYGDATKCGNKDGSSTDGKIKDAKKSSLKTHSNSSVASIVIGMLLLVMVVSVGFLFIYAYTHPQSPAGLWLIENRRPWKRFKRLNGDEYAYSERV